MALTGRQNFQTSLQTSFASLFASFFLPSQAWPLLGMTTRNDGRLFDLDDLTFVSAFVHDHLKLVLILTWLFTHERILAIRIRILLCNFGRTDMAFVLAFSPWWSGYTNFNFGYEELRFCNFILAMTNQTFNVRIWSYNQAFCLLILYRTTRYIGSHVIHYNHIIWMRILIAMN